MAESSVRSMCKGSDVEHDYCCYVCEENGSRIEAQFFCEKCAKCYCESCNDTHSQMFKKHHTVGRGEKGQWPVKTDRSTIEPLFQCMEHGNEKLELFCEDHDKLLCLVCDLNSHRKCRVTRIADKVNGGEQIPDFKQMLCSIQSNQEQLEQRKVDRRKDILDLHATCDKQYEEIERFRKEIDESLNRLEVNAKTELVSVRSSLNTKFETDIQRCSTINAKLQCLMDALSKLGESPEHSYIAYRKFLELTRETDSLNITKTRKEEVNFRPQTIIKQYLLSMSVLGNVTCENVITANEIINVQNNKSDHNVRWENEDKCRIDGICELPSGEFVIIDSRNRSVKLLNTSYNVVSHLSLPESPKAICHIEASEFAVASNCKTNAVIDFMIVEENKLKKKRSVYLNHSSKAIAHCQSNLFVTTGNVLYLYALDGRQIKKIYEDQSNINKVECIAVSNDGTKIYVTNGRGSLVTLTINGTVLATLEYCRFALRYLLKESDVRVALSGQVLVCYTTEQCIFQVDIGGTQILATVGTKNVVKEPRSVCYSKRNSSVLVGMTNDKIIVLKYRI